MQMKLYHRPLDEVPPLMSGATPATGNPPHTTMEVARSHLHLTVQSHIDARTMRSSAGQPSGRGHLVMTIGISVSSISMRFLLYT
jgi:hypothetical protein